MTAFQAWWRDRTRREQWLLAIMAGLFVAVVGWLGIVQPVMQARLDTADRLARASVDLGAIRSDTIKIRAAEARLRAAAAEPLIETVRRRAGEAGFTGETIAGSDDGRVTMRLPAVKPATLLRWTADIEARDNVIIDRLAVTRNADATVAVELAFRGASK